MQGCHHLSITVATNRLRADCCVGADLPDGCGCCDGIGVSYGCPLRALFTAEGHLLRTVWEIRGVFGLTLAPKTSCVKDAKGYGWGCDQVKLRATFRAVPIKTL